MKHLNNFRKLQEIRGSLVNLHTSLNELAPDIEGRGREEMIQVIHQLGFAISHINAAISSEIELDAREVRDAEANAQS